MSNKLTTEEAVKLINTYCPQRLTSTKYRALQKEDRRLPSYHRLVALYGSWDAVCLALWGEGTMIREWTAKEAKQKVLQYFKTPVSSHEYARQRKMASSELPTFPMLTRLFGSWAEASVAIWQEANIRYRTWDDLDEIVQLIRSVIPTRVNSTGYRLIQKEHPELPEIETLYRKFDTWRELVGLIWDEWDPIWDRETVFETVKAQFPERVSSEVYEKATVGNPQLPAMSMIRKYWESWAQLGDALWGEILDWEEEVVISTLQSHFSEAPTQQAYENAIKEGLELPSVFVSQRLFGSYAYMMAIAFKGAPMGKEDWTRTQNRYTDEELIQRVQFYFKNRPSYSKYLEESLKRPYLPAKNTLALHFGSFSKAMALCFPEEVQNWTPSQWSKAQILARVQEAVLALGSDFNQSHYREWASTQIEATPSLGTIRRHFGSFSALSATLGVEAISIEEWDLDAINEVLEDYFSPSNISPYLKAYEIERQTYGGLPSATILRRYYGNWRQVVATFRPDLALEVREGLITQPQAIEILQLAYAQIGDPMMRRRYDDCRHQHPDLNWPSSHQISTCCGSWKQALELANIPVYHYKHPQAQVGSQSDALKELEVTSLKDYLTWCLD